MRRALRRLLPILLALAALPVLTPPALAEAPAGAPPSALAELQRLDGRVQSVGWKLARGNAQFCRVKARSVGLQLHDVYNYASPAAVRRALGLAGDIAVQAVAAGGPAARAGLKANDPVVEVAGQPVGSLARPKARDFARLARLHDRIDAALTAHGQLEIATLSPTGVQRMTILGEEVCASRFEMLTDGNRAAADGSRVVVSRKIVEFLREEDQFAAVLAHELAHNVLRHRSRLNAQGRTWSNIRDTEREADRLSVWLLANAGYDPAAAVRFMTNWGAANDHGIFSTPDHDRWRTRARLMEAELVKLQAARASAPAVAVDWTRAFPAGPANGPG